MHSLKKVFEQTEILLVLNKKMSFCWKNFNLTFSNEGTQSWYMYINIYINIYIYIYIYIYNVFIYIYIYIYIYIVKIKYLSF